MKQAEKMRGKKNETVRDLVFTLVINFTVAVVVTLIFAYRAGSLRGIADNFVASLVISSCIGLLVMLLLTLIDRYAGASSPALKWALRICGLTAATAVGFLAGAAILSAAGLLEAKYFWASFRLGIGFSLMLTLIIGVAIYVYENLRLKLEAATSELREKEVAEERARKLAAEARLSSLESRIHPHFLFNTLNSISSLIQEDPREAERMVERLAALLRFSLDSNHSGTVPLGREIKIVTDYLEIERARFGSRLRYSIDVPAELNDIEVPPLAVQTIVENSLKHAISQRREGGQLKVFARLVDGGLRVEVSDDGPGFRADQVMAGHGLDNLQSRLSALFDEGAALTVSNLDGRTVVAFHVPHSRTQTVAIV